MKKIIVCLIAAILLISLAGCGQTSKTDIVVTTAPLYDFTSALCEGTDIRITKLITENVSCLHDYTLQVNQMRSVEEASLTIISGAGLEDFMVDTLVSASFIADASYGIETECSHHAHDGHHHESDPHIWLSPKNARKMAINIYNTLTQYYPQHKKVFDQNLQMLMAEFDALDHYAEEQLSDLTCREIITFHDGFSYMAEAFDLHILKAIEEESGSEASAAELVELIRLVKDHALPCIFTEINGSASAAQIVSAETGVPIYSLSMAMGDSGYFESMYHNIDTLKEALE